MAEITLISGSTLGSAEYVSEHLAEKLEEAGHSTTIQHGPLIDDLQAEGIWLVTLRRMAPGTFPIIFCLSMKRFRRSRSTSLRSVLAQSASVAVNTIPSAEQLISSRRRSTPAGQNRLVKR